jgi:hypothetical protein
MHDAIQKLHASQGTFATIFYLKLAKGMMTLEQVRNV